MEATEFGKELDKALRLCRAAAELELPVEEMLEYVEEGEEALRADGLTREKAATLDEMTAIREILTAVAEVAAIGSKLPAAEATPAELSCPLPANLRGAK